MPNTWQCKIPNILQLQHWRSYLKLVFSTLNNGKLYPKRCIVSLFPDFSVNAQPNPCRSVRHMFDIMDVNGSGIVSYDEFIQIADIFGQVV